jgi:hypothetical protein
MRHRSFFAEHVKKDSLGVMDCIRTENTENQGNEAGIQAIKG